MRSIILLALVFLTVSSCSLFQRTQYVTNTIDYDKTRHWGVDTRFYFRNISSQDLAKIRMSIIHSNALPPTSVMTIPSGLMITGNVIPNVQKLWDITQTIEGLSNNGISTIERIPTTIAYQSAGAIDISSVITIFGNVTQGSSVQLDIGNLNLGVQSYIIPPIQANGTWSYPVNTQFLNPKWAGNIYYRVQNGISVQYVRYNVTTSKQFFIDVNELPADCILSRF